MLRCTTMKINLQKLKKSEKILEVKKVWVKVCRTWGKRSNYCQPNKFLTPKSTCGRRSRCRVTWKIASKRMLSWSRNPPYRPQVTTQIKTVLSKKQSLKEHPWKRSPKLIIPTPCLCHNSDKNQTLPVVTVNTREEAIEVQGANRIGKKRQMVCDIKIWTPLI